MVFQWQWHKYCLRAWLKTLESSGNLLVGSQVCTLTFLLKFMYNSVCVMHVQSLKMFYALSHCSLIIVLCHSLKKKVFNVLR